MTSEVGRASAAPSPAQPTQFCIVSRLTMGLKWCLIVLLIAASSLSVLATSAEHTDQENMSAEELEAELKRVQEEVVTADQLSFL